MNWIDKAIGVLALQLPIDEIDRVMTGNRSWRRSNCYC